MRERGATGTKRERYAVLTKGGIASEWSSVLRLLPINWLITLAVFVKLVFKTRDIYFEFFGFIL